MNPSHWLRVVLCGSIAGVAFALMSAVLVGVWGSEFLSAVYRSATARDGASTTGPLLYILTVAGGVWAMWLYSVIRPGSASSVKAGVIVGLAWWVIASLQSLKWIALLDIPNTAWLPLTANVLVYMVAALIGGYLYSGAQRSPLPAAQQRG